MGIARIEREFGVNVADYGRHSRGLLLSSGCGLMMAAMDEAIALRYAMDLDQFVGNHELARAPLRAIAADRLIDFVALTWFTVSSPHAIADILQTEATVPKVVYCGAGLQRAIFEAHGCECHVELADFLQALERFPAVDPVDQAIAQSAVPVRRMSWDRYILGAL